MVTILFNLLLFRIENIAELPKLQILEYEYEGHPREGGADQKGDGGVVCDAG